MTAGEFKLGHLRVAWWPWNKTAEIQWMPHALAFCFTTSRIYKKIYYKNYEKNT